MYEERINPFAEFQVGDSWAFTGMVKYKGTILSLLLLLLFLLLLLLLFSFLLLFLLLLFSAPPVC
jgi:hypothetical protein